MHITHPRPQAISNKGCCSCPTFAAASAISASKRAFQAANVSDVTMVPCARCAARLASSSACGENGVVMISNYMAQLWLGSCHVLL